MLFIHCKNYAIKVLNQFFLFKLIFVISFVTISSNDTLSRYYKTFYYQTENIVSHYVYKITGIGSKIPFNKTNKADFSLKKIFRLRVNLFFTKFSKKLFSLFISSFFTTP